MKILVCLCIFFVGASALFFGQSEGGGHSHAHSSYHDASSHSDSHSSPSKVITLKIIHQNGGGGDYGGQYAASNVAPQRARAPAVIRVIHERGQPAPVEPVAAPSSIIRVIHQNAGAHRAPERVIRLIHEHSNYQNNYNPAPQYSAPVAQQLPAPQQYAPIREPLPQASHIPAQSYGPP